MNHTCSASAASGGFALEFEFEGVGAGRFDGAFVKGETGIVAGAGVDELRAFDGHLGVFAGTRHFLPIPQQSPVSSQKIVASTFTTVPLLPSMNPTSLRPRASGGLGAKG